MRVRLRLVGPPLLRLLGVHPAVFVALINNPSNIVHHHHHHQPYIARFVSRSYTVCPFFFFFSSPLSTPWRNYIHFPPLRQHFEGFLRGEKKKRTSSFSFLFFLYTHTQWCWWRWNAVASSSFPFPLCVVLLPFFQASNLTRSNPKS